MIRDILLNTNKDDIAAVASGGGSSAIAVIRCSGDEVIEKTEKIFTPAVEGVKLTNKKGFTQAYGHIYEGDKLIDEVIISVYRAPHSFTGENSVEISCHGSVFIQRKIMELLSKVGIRPAEAGEFTMRAYANGKFDLAQAEAVADLIDASTEALHTVAVRHLRGNYSKKIKLLRDEFINFASLLELELDFSEEEVEFADRTQFLSLLDKIETEIKNLLDSYKLGRVLKSGIPVAIVGKPNVGKSTILNLLLDEEKAIVSEIPGTTRDVIEDKVNIGGYLFRFIDTAGIRKSENEIEKLGIERTFAKIEEASVILYITDNKGFDKEDKKRIAEMEKAGKKPVMVMNKIDLQEDLAPADTKDYLCISAKKRINTKALETALLDFVESFRLQDRNIVTEARHSEALRKTLNDLQSIRTGFEEDLPTDLIAIDVRNAMQNLGEITGEITSGDLLKNIFSKFCIGK